MQSRYAFLDTNIFLHYPPLEQIDWLRHLKSEKVTLVVTPFVIRELNKHKDAGTSRKIRDRAASALKALRGFSKKDPPIGIRDSVELHFQLKEPSSETFSSHDLAREVPDDYLVATILECKKERPEVDVLLVTHDLGLELKADAFQIPTAQLPDELKLPEQLDPAEKRQRELEEKVRRYENKMPDLKLLFKNGVNRLRLLRHANTNQQEIAERVAEIRQKHPRLKKAFGYSGADLMRDVLIPPAAIDDYNDKLEQFYGDYEKYLLELESWRQRVAELEISIVNDGTCPADDVTVEMFFPDGFSLFSQYELLEIPSAPTPPEKLKTALGALDELRKNIDAWGKGPMIPSDLFNPPRIESVFKNVSTPTIKRINSYKVEFEVRSLSHGFDEPLAPLYVKFGSVSSVDSFKFKYAIHARQLPERAEGNLHVIFELVSQGQR